MTHKLLMDAALLLPGAGSSSGSFEWTTPEIQRIAARCIRERDARGGHFSDMQTVMHFARLYAAVGAATFDAWGLPGKQRGDLTPGQRTFLHSFERGDVDAEIANLSDSLPPNTTFERMRQAVLQFLPSVLKISVVEEEVAAVEPASEPKSEQAEKEDADEDEPSVGVRHLTFEQEGMSNAQKHAAAACMTKDAAAKREKMLMKEAMGQALEEDLWKLKHIYPYLCRAEKFENVYIKLVHFSGGKCSRRRA